MTGAELFAVIGVVFFIGGMGTTLAADTVKKGHVGLYVTALGLLLIMLSWLLGGDS